MAVYKIDGQYRKFTGTLAITEASRTSKDEGLFKIYGDDQLLYTSPTMTAGVEPVSFAVDLTGVLTLKIVYENESFYTAQVYLIDAGLYQ